MVRKITPQKVGEILAEARNKRHINIDEAAKDLDIPFRYLEALETNNFKDLPNVKFVKQIFKKYCQYLKIDFYNTWQVYKNDYYFSTFNKSIKIQNRHFTSWPNLIRRLLIALVIGAILIFLFIKVEQIFAPPDLNISYPYDGLIVSDRQIILVGKSESEVQLIINNKEICVDEQGSFETIIDLQKGLNLIKISAKKRYSRLNEKEIRPLLKD